MMKKILYFAGFLFIAYFMYSLSFRVKLLFVSTSSMSPVIPKGTIILVDRNACPILGSVVTYKYKNGSLITHRVVKLNRSGKHTFFDTKGDANVLEDKVSVTQADIIGTVIFTFPFLGYGILALIHPSFLLLFFYIPIGHCFGKYCRKFVNRVSR